DKPSDRILFCCQLQKSLKPMKLEVESWRYLLLEHGIMKSTARNARMHAISAQKNLRPVAEAKAK
ncbi:unnamed protein product, partial [Laminaria digitata]